MTDDELGASWDGIPNARALQDLLDENARLRRILAAIADEVKLQSAYLHLYSDRIKIEEFDDREALLETFRNLANGVGPDGHEIK